MESKTRDADLQVAQAATLRLSVLEQGLEAIGDKPPARRERLEEAHDFVAYVEHELPAVLARFVPEQVPDARPPSKHSA